MSLSIWLVPVLYSSFRAGTSLLEEPLLRQILCGEREDAADSRVLLYKTPPPGAGRGAQGLCSFTFGAFPFDSAPVHMD